MSVTEKPYTVSYVCKIKAYGDRSRHLVTINSGGRWFSINKGMIEFLVKQKSDALRKKEKNFSYIWDYYIGNSLTSWPAIYS